MELTTLEIFCADDLTVKDRMTFDECTYRGVHVTFWSEETAESAKILDDAFDILFDEVMKMRKKEGVEKNQKLSGV